MHACRTNGALQHCKTNSWGCRFNCESCPAGYHGSAAEVGGRNTFDTSCVACASGKFNPDTARDADSCIDCQAGRFTDNTHFPKLECEVCAAGTHASIAKHECPECTAGKYSSTEQDNCKDCIKGTYSSAGWALCKLCDRGEFQEQKQQPFCKFCPRCCSHFCFCSSISYRSHSQPRWCSGYYTHGTENLLRLACTSCPLGRVGNLAKKEDDTGGRTSKNVECRLCPAGTYRDDSRAPEQVPHHLSQ
jgi:hypothetical protein